jgi:uncharacterized membrane protein YczE
MARRLTSLYAGLALFGLSVAVMVRARLGLDPWDVFHQGLARRAGLPLGTTVIIVSALVMLAWIPLRQRPGVGTISNAILVGVAIDGALEVLPTPHALPLRAAFLAAGVVLNGVATALYIDAGLGPGPRDGLMTGLAARGHSIRVVRTSIEVSVLAAGWLLGGTVGVGTVAYALAIGPLVQLLLPVMTSRREPSVASVSCRQVSPLTKINQEPLTNTSVSRTARSQRFGASASE